MNTISPVAQFLRANKAKAVNLQTYNSGYPYFKFMKYCDFVDPNGKYLGTMKRYTTPPGSVKSGSSYAAQEVYIRTFEDEGRKIQEQQVNQYITYAKIAGKDGEKDRFVPEKIRQEFSHRDEKENIVTKLFERVISSKLKKLNKDEPVGLSGLRPQNVYEALEPVQFTKTYTGTKINDVPV